MAQSENHHNIDLSLGLGSRTFSPAFSYNYNFALGKKGRLNIGPGLRLFTIGGNNWRFAEENAPNGNNGDGDSEVNAFVAETNQMFGFNLGIYLKYEITDFLEIGINVDAIGLSFGNEQEGKLTVAENGETVQVTNVGYINPNTLFDDGNVSNDMLWLGYRFKEKYLIRAGINFTGKMYRVGADQLPDRVESQNYERISTLGFVGFSYKF
ncbi:MAG: hypothetical protein MRZ79_15710 [Bacteroidia bacterium]|nr:hypothetical protein [Bacteroidia bacterium]